MQLIDWFDRFADMEMKWSFAGMDEYEITLRLTTLIERKHKRGIFSSADVHALYRALFPESYKY